MRTPALKAPFSERTNLTRAKRKLPVIINKKHKLGIKNECVRNRRDAGRPRELCVKLDPLTEEQILNCSSVGSEMGKTKVASSTKRTKAEDSTAVLPTQGKRLRRRNVTSQVAGPHKTKPVNKAGPFNNDNCPPKKGKEKELFIKLDPLSIGGTVRTHDEKPFLNLKVRKEKLAIKASAAEPTSEQHLKVKDPLKVVKAHIEKSAPAAELQGHNLRRQIPKNYLEESTLNGSKVQKPIEPIYRRAPPADEAKTKKDAISDPYEFTDSSPKNRRIRPHRSSMLFDKDTYEILQKIEQREAKAKRAVKQRRPKAQQGKTYDNIVKGIVSNVMAKISLKGPALGAVPPNEGASNSSDSINFENSLDFDPVHSSASSLHGDVEDCFGFEDVEPIRSTPVPNQSVRILSSVVLRSPIEFHAKRPNANSTMIPTSAPSPWRPNLITKSNPHFLKVKGNALPCIDQDMVSDYSLVQSLNLSASKKENRTPIKRPPVQQSILDFIDSNIEKENGPLERSLYDYEAFNSPKKKKRRALADISNSPEKSSNMTLFGFDRSVLQEEKDEDLGTKPSRFDLSALKCYSKKKAPVSAPIIQEEEIHEISLFEVSNEDDAQQEIRLFEDPEEMLDQQSPVCISERKGRRKRLHSCDSDVSDHERRRKRPKKTKFEIEQEEWAKKFNEECDEIAQVELELE